MLLHEIAPARRYLGAFQIQSQQLVSARRKELEYFMEIEKKSQLPLTLAYREMKKYHCTHFGPLFLAGPHWHLGSLCLFRVPGTTIKRTGG
jgi:hypothetical protein